MGITRPKHLSLQAVGRFQYLSNDQLRRHIYGSSVLKYIQGATSELVKDGLLQRLYLPTLTPHGRPRTFYALTDAGYKYLGDRSLPPPPRFKNKQDPFRHGLFLLHFELSSDLVILACDLPRRDKRVTISRFLTEAQIKHRRPPVRPDGWVEFQVQQPASVIFELDRGTEAREDWQKKIRAYASYVRGQYQYDYGIGSYPTIAVVTTTERRVAELLNWTQEVLYNDSETKSLLSFTCFNPVEITSTQAFLSPIWVTPDDPYPQQLLPQEIFGHVLSPA